MGDIKVDVKEVGCEGMDRIHLVQDTILRRAFVNAVMNIWVPQNAKNFSTG
jgi:hypothetical protein